MREPVIPLPPSADSIPRASIAMWRLTVEAVEGAWMTEQGGAAAVVTRIPVGGFNGVWTEQRDVSPSIVAELLDRVAATGLPYSLHLRAKALPELEAVARARGMILEAEEPVMILENPSSLAAALDVPDLTIRRLEPHEGGVHSRIAAVAFGDTPDAAKAAASPEIMSARGHRFYAGEVAGKAVATALGVTHLGTTAVFAVATLPEHRGRGYGTALTARAVLDGLAEGAAWAWLQADPGATRMYERLGFRTVETASVWASD